MARKIKMIGNGAVYQVLATEKAFYEAKGYKLYNPKKVAKAEKTEEDTRLKELKAMTNSVLTDLALELGIDVPTNPTKDVLVDVIMLHEATHVED